ncbi:nucleotidyltransferase family protein [bacterium]|nr:nucleotidyltransferase family protein [bacterium]
MTYGIILAAGESKRIGTPKALLKINAETFMERIASVLHNTGIQNIILVAGTHYEEIRKNVKSITIVFNAQHPLGQFSSLQAGLRELPKQTEFVIVWPVDLPLIRKETIETLLAAAQSKKHPITVPVYQGRKGHPVVYSVETITKILSMEPTHTGKELFEHFEGRITFTDVEDPAVLIDVDTPEDYERYIKRGDLSLPT